MSDFKHQLPMADDQEHVEDDSKTFPMKLVEILADERYQDAISWLPHGRAFIVRNRKLFAEQVMPLHFSRKAKYSSFTRKLNRWYVTSSRTERSFAFVTNRAASTLFLPLKEDNTDT